MAVSPKAPKEVDHCRHLLLGMAKNLVDRLYGPDGPPWGTPFSALEDTALLLAQSSDWQFIISTGAVADYAVRRISEHCDDLEQLLAFLRGGEGGIEAGQRLADELQRRDGLFPDVLPALALALRGSRAW